MSLVLESTELETESSARTDRPWLLVVYDDPVNLMSFVVMVFEKVLKMNTLEAESKMWEVHSKGRSVVWEGSRELGEMFLQQIHFHGLQAKLEKSGSDD